MRALATTMFLGAFLLFQVQPMIAHYILPWFGGSPAVWTTAMLFFQVMLLAGYGYTHFIVGRLPLKRQVIVHLLLLAFTLFLLPITPAESLKPDGSESPLWAILLLLTVSVGMPYLLVASTAPLMQSWYTKIQPRRSPYGLYALSNSGSVLGLLVYPFLVEPLFGSYDQTLMWSLGYALFVLVTLWAAIPIYRLASDITSVSIRKASEAAVPMADQLLWLALSACGVVVLLAATNQLCKDVAVVPLLWVLPLTLYLLSFVVSFGMPRFYNRLVWTPLLLVSTAAAVVLLLLDNVPEELNLYWQIFIYSAVVFTCSMVCHGELFRLRPAADQLTLFSLILSLGGALGGIFVNLIAPLVFLGYWEFHWSLVATFILLGYCVAGDRSLPSGLWQTPTMVVGWAAVGTLVFFLTYHMGIKKNQMIETHRSFYGILRVQDSQLAPGLQLRKLLHGRINHGSQLRNAKLAKRPVSYYGGDSGVSVAVSALRSLLVGSPLESQLRIGVIGKEGDVIRFYEIDPGVSDIANTYFTYLSESKADTEIIIGDARISMESELRENQRQDYDLLVLDAFSGDGIPVHLLTREALAVYRQHLSPKGVIAIHISNRHFNLRSVVRSLADNAGLYVAWIEDPGARVGETANDWMLLTTGLELKKQLQAKASRWSKEDYEQVLWTDDYANLFAAARAE